MLNPRYMLHKKYFTAKNFIGVSQFYRDHAFHDIFLTKMNFQSNQSLLFIFDLIPRAIIETPFTTIKLSYNWDDFYLDLFA